MENNLQQFIYYLINNFKQRMFGFFLQTKLYDVVYEQVNIK